MLSFHIFFIYLITCLSPRRESRSLRTIENFYFPPIARIDSANFSFQMCQSSSSFRSESLPKKSSNSKKSSIVIYLSKSKYSRCFPSSICKNFSNSILCLYLGQDNNLIHRCSSVSSMQCHEDNSIFQRLQEVSIDNRSLCPSTLSALQVHAVHLLLP